MKRDGTRKAGEARGKDDATNDMSTYTTSNVASVIRGVCQHRDLESLILIRGKRDQGERDLGSRLGSLFMFSTKRSQDGACLFTTTSGFLLHYAMSSLSTHVRPSLTYSQPSDCLDRPKGKTNIMLGHHSFGTREKRRDRSRMAWSPSKRARARTGRCKVIRQNSSCLIRLYSFICLSSILTRLSHSKVLA
ncbi:hypothetical protein BKA80DRAFT_265430 [Phyllosticta citrichinensis]